MKKFKLFILFLLAILIMPIIARADGGSPSLLTYEIVVTESDGAPYYAYELDKNDKEYLKKKGTIKYNQKLLVIDDTNIDGEIYYEIYYRDSWETDDIPSVETDLDGSEIYYINSKYASPINEYYMQDEKEKVDRQAYIFKKGVDVRKGPSQAFDVVGTLEVGTEINLYYIEDSRDDLWYYIENETIKGWIYANNDKVGINETDEYMIPQDAKIKDIDGNNIGVIPGNTIIKPNYYIKAYKEDEYYYKLYITYDGISGFINSSNATQDDYFWFVQEYTDASEFMTAFDMNVYKTVDCRDIIIKIPVGSTILFDQVLYSHKYKDKDYFYIYEYWNGDRVEGWIKVSDLVSISNDDDQVILLNEINVVNMKTLESKTIPANSQISYYSLSNDKYEYLIKYNREYWYVKNGDELKETFYSTSGDELKIEKDTKIYKTYLGAIKGDEKELIATLSKDLIATIMSETRDNSGNKYYYVVCDGKIGWIKEDDEEDENDDKKDPDVIPIEKKKLTSKQLIILCVAGGAILSETALVTIVLINKKRKKKQESIALENKENKTVEEQKNIKTEENAVEETKEEDTDKEESVAEEQKEETNESVETTTEENKTDEVEEKTSDEKEDATIPELKEEDKKDE